MNEITRIHIAKVAYDVEVTAKKQLEKYIKSLETYTHDTEVLGDIEIRITELLDERGVKAGGVISSDDVTAVREQLGEPYEFADEDGDIAVGSVEERDGRKFFRSTDDAVLGGVLSGIAAYFSVNPLWPRLIFILITAISFGTAAFAYILLWMVVPPARTATEKLRQAGRPVTLDSIRELNESAEAGAPNRVAPTVKRFFGVSLGVLSLLGAVTTLAFIVFCIVSMFGIGVQDIGTQLGLVGLDNSLTFAAWIVYGLVLTGLALLAGLFSLAAYAFLAQKLTKRMLVSGVVIVALGLMSFAATVGIVATQSWRVSTEAQRLMKTTNVTLPEAFAGVKSIEIDNEGPLDESEAFRGYPSIQYVVDEGTPRYELSALPGVKPVVTVDGETAKISFGVSKDYRNSFVQARLVVYGPAIENLTNNATSASYTGVAQSSLQVTSDTWANLSVNGGRFEAVTVNGGGTVDLASASVTTLRVTAQEELTVNAGTVRELNVTQPDVCPSGDSANSRVLVSGVTSNVMIHNNQSREAKTYRTNCAEVIIGDEYDYHY